MKIIIWGHVLHQSSHSYLHSSYYKAFKYLGYDTIWLPDENNDSLDCSNAIFFVEDQNKKHLPLKKNCKYITHHIDTTYFTDAGIPYENILKLGNYLPRETIHENISDFAYWDQSTRTLFQCWGTDLLPYEINNKDPIKFNPNNIAINYIGSLNEQGEWWTKSFAQVAKHYHNIPFQQYHGNISDTVNLALIRNSFLCPDFRSDWHIECGYIPCRIFKNISYGRVVGTNSSFIKQAFGDYVAFGATPHTLYQNLLDMDSNQKINMVEAMTLIKDKHTFINRINNILQVL